MTEKAPVLDVFIGRHGNVWRMVFAPLSWMPPMLQVRTNDRREIFPAATRPDADDL